ncbi:MAG: hypothetical protein S4CHLAM37_05940 [Chlamydiia bacterium]|nr:hypothetical protein [Chlamydiia bacterium]
MKEILVIVGLSGCGKSTLLKKLAKERPEVSVVNYGRAILSVANEQKLEPDTIRKQCYHMQKALRRKAAHKIVHEATGVTVVDTHCFIKSKGGFIPGLPLEVIDLFKPKAFIFVKADPEEIFHRRLRDKLRERDKQDLDEIAYHQELSKSFVVSCVFHTGVPLKVIHNREGLVDSASEKLINFIEAQKKDAETQS